MHPKFTQCNPNSQCDWAFGGLTVHFHYSNEIPEAEQKEKGFSYLTGLEVQGHEWHQPWQGPHGEWHCSGGRVYDMGRSHDETGCQRAEPEPGSIL